MDERSELIHLIDILMRELDKIFVFYHEHDDEWPFCAMDFENIRDMIEEVKEVINKNIIEMKRIGQSFKHIK